MSRTRLPGHDTDLASPMPSLTILGAGYVGKALLARHPEAVHTHRAPKPDDPTARVFSLEDKQTWEALPLAGRLVLWTFPARPLELVQEFHQTHLRRALGVIVLGSTSAYRVEGEAGTWVYEEAPLDLTQERVQGEEWLRTQGATVLQLAGIHGPDRLPLNWLRKGLIRNGRKWLNLAHVDDIVAAIEALAMQPQPGARINVADGRPIVWNDLVEVYRQRGELPGDFALPQGAPEGKRIANERLRRLLPGHDFCLP